MNIEKKRISICHTEKGEFGHISLDKLAKPETVKVTLLGEPLIPESFDCFGHPKFTIEQGLLFMYKENELNRQYGSKFTPLEAEITYEELNFDVTRKTFDTLRGIKNSLTNLSDLNNMLQSRKIFYKANGINLNQFILFGCFYLDKFGQVLSIEKADKGKFICHSEIEHFDTFLKNNNTQEIVFTSNGYSIPTSGDICPCCGKKFTIDDIKNNSCVFESGKLYHNNCWRNYRKLKEIYMFTNQLMDLVYKETDYHFSLLPNGYLNTYDYSYIPWFLFHTIDGDIIIGHLKNSISIEWQENYKSFNFNNIFISENVTKWQDNGKRHICATDMPTAYKYLEKVVKAINPSYSPF